MNKVKWIKIQIANSQKNLYNGTQNYEKILMKTCAVPLIIRIVPFTMGQQWILKSHQPNIIYCWIILSVSESIKKWAFLNWG